MPDVTPATDPIPVDARGEVRDHALAIGRHVRELGHPGPAELATADLLLLAEYVVRLIDEVTSTEARADKAEATVRIAVDALDGIAEDECLNRIPDDGPDPDEWDGDPPEGVWPCLCAHHWALYALAHVAGFPNKESPDA